MDTENLKKFINELTDIISAERKIVLTFIGLAILIKFFFWGLDSFNNTHSKNLEFASIHSNPGKEIYTSSDPSAKTELFSFEPATASREELITLGFSPKVADILINYRTKGGQFRDKSDVKKIYGVTPELFTRLEPYIIIHERTNSYDKYDDSKKTNAPKVIDVNMASKEDWKSLPGIGDYFAQKFVEKRMGLGAYVQLEQIAEVYKLPDSTFQKIKPYLKLSKGSIKKININTAKEEELRQHPYILRWQADDILRNRPIYGLEDLYDLKTYSDREKHKYVHIYFEF
jgi:DNA uptake protein ComE-like DNA-binding protein